MEELQELSPEPAPDEDVITFTFKRSYLFALLIPLAFTLGLGAGYLFWGTNTPAANVEQSNDLTTRYSVEISADDPSIGSQDAQITMIEFSDFECPYCRRFHDEVFARLMQDYGDSIYYVYKDFPLSSIHPNATPAAEAALCAKEQDAFWQFHDALFSMQLGLSAEAYSQYAQNLGLNVSTFTQCMDERRYASDVQDDFNYAVSLGVRSTPTFFINGIAIIGAQPYEVFAQVIEAELAGSN